MNSVPTGRQRSTRDRPAKAPLSVEAVVEAALGILKSEGLEAVSMRRVAAALDTGPASLYVYVAGREGLLAAMQDRIIATVTLEPPDPAHWREQVHRLLGRMHAALVAHPGIAALSIAGPPTSEATLVLLENLLGLLHAGGLDPQDAAWAADIFAALVTYAALEEDAWHAGRRVLADELYAQFTGLPPARFPIIVASAAQIVAGDADQRFHYAVDVVLDGMLARSGHR